MRIISKFKDYWDSGMGQGQDRSLVFVREQEVFDDNTRVPAPTTFKPFLEIAQTHPSAIHLRKPVPGVWDVYVGFGLLWVAGRLYPCAYMHVSKDSLEIRGPARYFYNYAGLAAALKEFDYDLDQRKKRTRYRGWRIQVTLDTKKWFALAGSEQLIAQAFEHRIALASSFPGSAKLNPRLADYEFFRTMDPFQAYQELSMFWGNLAAPDRVPVTVAEKDRIAQHGFDEWSFRKMPASGANL